MDINYEDLDKLEVARIEGKIKNMEISIGYTIRGGSLRRKTFTNPKKAFNFWMDKPDGAASIETDPPTYSSYTHIQHAGLMNRENIYNRFIEGITPED